MVFANFQEDNVITGIVDEIEDVIESSIEIFGSEYEVTYSASAYRDAYTTMLCCEGDFYLFLADDLRVYDLGEYILSFFLLLVFYLLVDKKVWKS